MSKVSKVEIMRKSKGSGQNFGCSYFPTERSESNLKTGRCSKVFSAATSLLDSWGYKAELVSNGCNAVELCPSMRCMWERMLVDASGLRHAVHPWNVLTCGWTVTGRVESLNDTKRLKKCQMKWHEEIWNDHVSLRSKHNLDEQHGSSLSDQFVFRHHMSSSNAKCEALLGCPLNAEGGESDLDSPVHGKSQINFGCCEILQTHFESNPAWILCSCQ